MLKEFDIQIKDSFLDKKDFETVTSYSQNILWESNGLVYDAKNPNHVWFTSPAPDEISNILKKQVSKFFNVEVLNVNMCCYTMVAKSKKIQAHPDISDDFNFQIILYLKGEQNINCGTGFYMERDDGSIVLNTSVGFNPNRMVSWTSGVWHSPLSFTDDFKPRISMVAQYKLKKLPNG